MKLRKSFVFKSFILKVFILFVSLVMTSMDCDAAVVVGNPRGEITLVEIFDYQCPHCRDMWPIINLLIKRNPDLRVGNRR